MAYDSKTDRHERTWEHKAQRERRYKDRTRDERSRQETKTQLRKGRWG